MVHLLQKSGPRVGLFGALLAMGIIPVYFLTVENPDVTSSTTDALDTIQTVAFGDTVFVVDVADTRETRYRGLSGRGELAANQGMLFVFDRSGDYDFTMRDMRFPLDILWLDENWRVVHIEEDLQPESYPESYRSNSPAQYVLEINAGSVAKEGIEIGEQAVIK